MPEGLILKSASFEPGGDEAREENLESVLENAGLEVVEPVAGPEGEAAAHAEALPPKKSRKERAIEKATAPLLERIKHLEAGRPQEAQTETEAAQAAQRQHLERNLQSYAAQVKEAKNRHEDWDRVVNQDIFIGPDSQLAILEQENAAELIYHLGRNPVKAAELGELNRRSPVAAIAEVGRLSARLSGEGRHRPRVPAPVRTVSTAGSSATLSFAEIAARPNYPGKARDLKRAQADR